MRPPIDRGGLHGRTRWGPAGQGLSPRSLDASGCRVRWEEPARKDRGHARRLGSLPSVMPESPGAKKQPGLWARHAVPGVHWGQTHRWGESENGAPSGALDIPSRPQGATWRSLWPADNPSRLSGRRAPRRRLVAPVASFDRTVVRSSHQAIKRQQGPPSCERGDLAVANRSPSAWSKTSRSAKPLASRRGPGPTNRSSQGDEHQSRRGCRGQPRLRAF